MRTHTASSATNAIETRLSEARRLLRHDRERRVYSRSIEVILRRSGTFGNSVAIMDLVRLHEITGKARYDAVADASLRYFAELLQRGSAAPLMLRALSQTLEERIIRHHI